MNPLRVFFFVACLTAATMASPLNGGRNNNNNNNNKSSSRNSLKPSDWLSASTLASLPSLDEISLEKLEKMSAQEGAELMDTMYHLSQITQELKQRFVPSKSNIPCYIVKPNGQNVSTTLDKLVSAAENQPKFGEEELTLVLLGLPQKTHSIKKATRQLIQNYMEKYDAELQQKRKQQRSALRKDNDDENKNNNGRDSSEESDEDNWTQSNSQQRATTGDVVVINIGDACGSFPRLVQLDIEKTGEMLAEELAKLTEQCNVPEEIIHIVAQGKAAHVAGVTGRKYKAITGHSIRRITALDPSKIFAKNPNTLTSLARGDADFVDAIHTTAHGLGTEKRVGDVDFFPNGPCDAVPGTDNVVEASMRATRYFAESVRPGNERNFPAVGANSLKQYKNKNGHGKRAYMGIDTDFDLEGDYILQVNQKAPFGKSAPAEKQAFHNAGKWDDVNGKKYE